MPENCLDVNRQGGARRPCAYRNLMDRLAVHEMDAETSDEICGSKRSTDLVRPDVSGTLAVFTKVLLKVMLCVCLAGPADIIHVL